MYVHTCTYLRLLAHYTPKIAFNVLRLRVLTDATEVGDDVLVAAPLGSERGARAVLVSHRHVNAVLHQLLDQLQVTLDARVVQRRPAVAETPNRRPCSAV